MPTKLFNARFPNYDDAVLALVKDRFETSQANFEPLFHKTSMWYDMYRSWYREPDAPEHRNNVFVPMTFSTVWSDVARKSSASFGAHPFVAFTGYGEEDAPIARQQELLVSAQMRDSGSYLKGIDTFLMGDLYGTCPIQVGWRYDETVLPERQMLATPITQTLVERVRTRKAVLFDGPDWEPFDIIDFFPQPRIARLRDMRWKIRRYYLDLDDIRAFERLGFFDKGTARELELEPPANTISEEFLRRNRANMYNSIRTEKYAKPVELIEMWGMLPDDLIPSDGVAKRVVTIANRKVICRNRPNPFHHGHDPFLSYTPVVDPHYFHGPSKVEGAIQLNAVANRLMNARLDVLDLIVDPPHMYNKMLGVDPDNLYVRPGRWIGVEGSPGADVHPLTPDLRGFQLSYQEVEYAWRWLQNASGIHEDAVMGAAGPDRETAYAFRGRTAAVNTRLLLETRIFEEQVLEPLANFYRLLNRQFLPIPLKRKILGSNAITDPVTGMPIPQEILVDDYALAQDYDARALGSSQVVPKEARQQNFLAMLEVAAKTPGAQILNWVSMFRQMFRQFDLTNIDELFISPPLQQLAMQMSLMQQGAAPGGGMGMAPGGPAGGPPPANEQGATDAGREAQASTSNP